MSAWYVLSASGFYPVRPGKADYAIGSPLFKKVTYHLENGKTFTIAAPKVSAENFYIKSAMLNGVEHSMAAISHEDIEKGGTLEFEMSPVPVTKAFPSYLGGGTTGGESVGVPLIIGKRVFSGQTQVTLRPTFSSTKIYYTTDGTPPTTRSREYSVPFMIADTTTVKAVATNFKGVAGIAAEAKFSKRANDWTIKIASSYSTQYTGGGYEGLVNGIRGTTNFASGDWQGYQGKDFVATIDLQKETELRKVGGGFLQVARSWIWMPTHIEFEVSSDGVSFTKVADIKTDISATEMEPTMRDYSVDISPVKTRFVRVHAYNLGKVPSWHPGAGGDPWIFVDEVFVR
jgi:Glycosyl hydrolase family 92/Chitobiase/beta-hexosaminidase C-terminal domain/F5/8 type C domain